MSIVQGLVATDHHIFLTLADEVERKTGFPLTLKLTTAEAREVLESLQDALDEPQVTVHRRNAQVYEEKLTYYTSLKNGYGRRIFTDEEAAEKARWHAGGHGK